VIIAFNRDVRVGAGRLGMVGHGLGYVVPSPMPLDSVFDLLTGPARAPC
jgi:hypothetical protein